MHAGHAHAHAAWLVVEDCKLAISIKQPVVTSTLQANEEHRAPWSFCSRAALQLRPVAWQPLGLCQHASLSSASGVSGTQGFAPKQLHFRDREGRDVTVKADIIVNCAGLHAQEVAASLQGLPPEHVPARHLARGCYFTLQGVHRLGHWAKWQCCRPVTCLTPVCDASCP